MNMIMPEVNIELPVSGVYHVSAVAPSKIFKYWLDLEDRDYLKYRLSAIARPGWSDVIRIFKEFGRNMYVAMEDGEIKGEFALEAFTGKAAQIHFSMHPDTKFKDVIRIGTSTCDEILGQWTDNHGNPYLRSLYANIAVSNRASCLSALKMGFKKIGMLPSGMYVARHNRYEDGTILVRTL